MSQTAAFAPVGPDVPQRTLFGHPHGLYVLFFTEMWERFSFYGMKALLILYMVNYLVWTQEGASHVMAWYAGLVYCTPVLGGIVADKLFGARWSVLAGGILIAIGHFLLAFESLTFFYSGLGFLIAGVGLLKPNISTQVGSLYAPDDARRDSAFTIFYMGINIGALLGPIICARLQIHYSWHHGFGAAGVGMVIGLIIYILGMRSVVRRAAYVAASSVNASSAKADPAAQRRQAKPETPAHVARDRIFVLLVIFVFAIIFWMAFEQAANVMTVWADKHTNLYPFRATAPEAEIDTVAAAGPAEGESWRDFNVSAPDLLAVNPFFIIALAAFFAWLWIWLEKRKKQPSTPAKMVLGFVGMTLAYLVMVLAARAENQPSSVSLDAVPQGVVLEDYGATRLRYDEPTTTLHMAGVLPELDRLRVLGDSAPEAYRQAVKTLAEHAEVRSENAADDEEWQVQVVLSADAVDPARPQSFPEAVRWDPNTRALIATAVIPEREVLVVMAAGAPAGFRAAVDSIYQQSSLHKANLWWLILFYLLCTMGELCLSPVGLSAVTKMAPPRYVGLFMGLWFLFTGGIANFLAHMIGGYWGSLTPIDYFMIFGSLSLAAMLLMALLVRMLRRMTHGVH